MERFSKEYNSIVSLLFVLIALALGYILELNQLKEAKASLLESQQKMKEFNLEYQEYVNTLSFTNGAWKLEDVQKEFLLEEVKGFTLLEQSEAQLSLNPKTYE